MALLFLQNSTAWLHDTDFSGYLRKVAPKVMADELDATTFGATYKSRIGGLKDVSLDAEGFWDSPPDASAFAALGSPDRVATFSPEGAETKVAYLAQLGEFGYEAFGQVGQQVPFTFSMKGTNNVGLVRGQIAKAKGTVAATGQLGSILTIAGPTASQFVYATLHVFVAATTITVQVQSAPTVGFAAPVVRGTMGPITLTGGTWLVRVPGAITDGFWRLFVSAITGTFTAAGGIGIQ